MRQNSIVEYANPRKPMEWKEIPVDAGWSRTWVNGDVSYTIEDRGGSFTLFDTNGMGMQHDYWSPKGAYGSLEVAQRAARTVQNPYAPEYEYESKPLPPPPPRRDEEDWRKHLGYPPEMNPHELLDDEDDEVELVGVVAARRGYTQDVHDHIDKQIATDWIEEKTGTVASEITSQLPDKEVAKWLVENLDLNEKDAKEAACMMSVSEDHEPVLGERHGREYRMTDYDILAWINNHADNHHGMHGIEHLWVSEGELNQTGGGDDFPVAQYINTGDTYNLTVLFDIDEDKFYLITYGDWVERWERRREAARMYIKLDNMEEREDGSVMITMSGPGAAAKAKDDQSIVGGQWETDGDDFAYAMPLDYPGLLEELEAAGYDVNTDEYSEPEEDEDD